MDTYLYPYMCTRFMCETIEFYNSCETRWLVWWMDFVRFRRVVTWELDEMESSLGKGIKDDFILYKRASRAYYSTSVSLRVKNEKLHVALQNYTKGIRKTWLSCDFPLLHCAVTFSLRKKAVMIKSSFDKKILYKKG